MAFRRIIALYAAIIFLLCSPCIAYATSKNPPDVSAVNNDITERLDEEAMSFLISKGVKKEAIEKLDASSLKSLILQAKAYGFTDEQVRSYVKGLLSEINMKVNSVSYSVTINDTIINNSNDDYPLLLYKSITYIPLTSDYCQCLGIDFKQDSEVNIAIGKKEVTAEYNIREGDINNMSVVYDISIPSYQITINDKLVNNDSLEWPFIYFHNMTYMPLTWDYAVNELGLSYSWDSQKGLSLIHR